MKIKNTEIIDTFAEAFRMVYARIGVTAHDSVWLQAAIDSFTGYGTSVIGCDAEVGVERMLDASLTPDGRCGVICLVFGFSVESLGKAILNRVGQCLMTCPSTMVFDGSTLGGPSYTTADEDVPRVSLGKQLRYFGDGFQKSKMIGNERFWRVPVMDGEFVVVESVQVHKGVAGGNLLIQSVDEGVGLDSLRRGIEAIRSESQGVILPFPGGAVRSGSKVGSRYAALRASTSHRYCPTLRGRVDSLIHEDAACVHEIVIDGVDQGAIRQAMLQGMLASAGKGVVAISAGNYGGKLGKFHFHLHEILSRPGHPAGI